jgi:hypothetical protein
VLGIKTVVAFLRDSHRGSLGLMRARNRGFANCFITNIEDLVKYDAHCKELAIEIAKIVQRYENDMKNIILKEYCKSILTFLAVGLIILFLFLRCQKKDSSKTTESTKIESTDKSKLTSPKIQNRKSRKLKRSTIRTRPPSRKRLTN